MKILVNRKKHNVLVLSVVLGGMMLAGCGASEGENIDTKTQNNTSIETIAEDTGDAAKAEELVKENDEEVQEVEKPVIPFAEENALVFTEKKSFQTPYALSFSNADFTEKDEKPREGVSFEKGPVNYEIESIVARKSEEREGYVDVTFTTLEDYNSVWTLGEGVEETGPFTYSTASFKLADYYTGKTFPGASTMGDKKAFSHEITIEWEDESYDIFYSYSHENIETKWSDWETEDGINYTSVFHVSAKSTWIITMPENYDGLIAYLRKTVDEEVDFDELNKAGTINDCNETLLLDSDGNTYTTDDYELIRISDVMTMEE